MNRVFGVSRAAADMSDFISNTVLSIPGVPELYREFMKCGLGRGRANDRCDLIGSDMNHFRIAAMIAEPACKLTEQLIGCRVTKAADGLVKIINADQYDCKALIRVTLDHPFKLYEYRIAFGKPRNAVL